MNIICVQICCKKFDTTGCLKKNVVSWKNSHNYPQTHPKCKCWGCFGKFRIFAIKWALRFSKLKKKWLNPKLGNPSLTAHNKYSLIIFTILCCIWVLGLNTSGQRYKIFFKMSSNFWLHFLSQFFFNFKNISGHWTANILNF